MIGNPIHKRWLTALCDKANGERVHDAPGMVHQWSSLITLRPWPENYLWEPLHGRTGQWAGHFMRYQMSHHSFYNHVVSLHVIYHRLFFSEHHRKRTLSPAQFRNAGIPVSCPEHRVSKSRHRNNPLTIGVQLWKLARRGGYIPMLKTFQPTGNLNILSSWCPWMKLQIMLTCSHAISIPDLRKKKPSNPSWYKAAGRSDHSHHQIQF